MFLNLISLFEVINGYKNKDRLEQLLRAAGCTFHEPGLLATPTVGIVGIGGLPVTSTTPLALGGIPFPLESIRAGFTTTRGLGGMITYLNPGEKTPEQMVAVQNQHGHYSTAHMAHVSIGVFGLSIGVEPEFDTQRDTVHLARLTVSATGAQDEPPLVVPNAHCLEAYRKLRKAILQIRSTMATTNKAEQEMANTMWPKASATMLVVSGTLRNLHRLVAQEDDSGKEVEYRHLLRMIRHVLSPLAPDMFQSNPT